MPKKLLAFLDKETTHLKQAGLFRKEAIMRSAQGEKIAVGNRKLINLASNDYLGLADHPALKEGAKKAIDSYGVGVASPRMIAGTQTVHTRLERALTSFLNTESTLLYASGYHANTGLFESLLGERDFIFCDALCHPSLADGIRLCRARVFLYRNNDFDHLEDRLKRSRSARFRVIVTDGVFGLDGAVAELKEICDLADKYEALVVADDAQGVGVLGAQGRGTHEFMGVMSKVGLLTGTFSNALGGGAGGYVSGRRQVIAWLRQKSRPYLVSSALCPASAGAALAALELVEGNTDLRQKLFANVAWFRNALTNIGLQVVKSEHPIVAILVGEAVSAQRMVDKLYNRGVHTMGYCYPVVPEGEARVRAQITAQHLQESLSHVVHAFEAAAKELKLIQ